MAITAGDVSAETPRTTVAVSPETPHTFDIYAETEMAPWLDRVTAPTQIITGELDGGCNPRLNREIHAAMPGSELVILDRLKHAIFIEATDRVLPDVRRFLLAQGTGG